MKSKFELFSWGWSHKAVETIRNINNAFGLETSIERTMQWWFKKFCKGDKSLEDEDHGGWPLKIDNDHLRTVINAGPLRTTQAVREPSIHHSMVIWHLKQIGKLKELGASWADRKSKKSSFWSGIFSYSTQQIVSQLDCDMSQKVTFIWQLSRTSSVVGLRRSSKAVPKAKLAPKKVMVTDWWLPACLIH